MISSAAREENVRALASRQFPDAWHIKMEAAIPDKALGSTIIISGGGNIEPVARSIMAFVASLYSARHLPADAKRALPVKMESLIGAAQALSKQVAMDRASPHWSRFHGHSEELAAEAQLAIIAGDDARARNLYLQAAQWEEGALNVLNPANRRTQRTFWITAESAVALWYKAAEYNCARHLANSLLTLRNIPADPREALMEMLNGLAAQEARHG